MNNSIILEVSMKILIVDDDASTLEMLKNALEINGYECDAYDDAREALDNYQPYKYDVVLCDYFMPNINGIDFLKNLKALNDDVVFILYSGSPNQAIIKEAFNFGATDFLNKPMDWTAFIELIQFYECSFEI
jgi:DNA-binding NtrC family response regulator